MNVFATSVLHGVPVDFVSVGGGIYRSDVWVSEPWEDRIRRRDANTSWHDVTKQQR